MTINGKSYPMWEQFVERKAEFIGGVLEDHDSDIQRFDGVPCAATTITDIILEPNGTDSAMFSVCGQGFSCGGDVRHLGIGGGEEGWVTLYGYGGHMWRIKAAAGVPQ